MPSAVVRINITPDEDTADSVLLKVIDRLSNEFQVTGAVGDQSVESTVTTRVGGTSKPEVTLDLIGHSVGGVLQLGDWNTSKKAPAKELKKQWKEQVPDLDLAEIRLLGCNTAHTDAGYATMGLLHDIFVGTVIKGTTVPISQDDFSTTEFTSESVLKKYKKPKAPGAKIASDALRMRWFARFPSVWHQTLDDVLADLEPESFVVAIRDLLATRERLRWPLRRLAPGTGLPGALAGLDQQVRSVPGLLALPDREILVRAAGSIERFHRITFLLGGAFLRIYPRGHSDGVLVRVPSACDGALRGIWTQSQNVPLPPD